VKRLVLLAVVALLPFGWRPAIAANPLYDHNLIVNGNAEPGEGLPGAGTIPGWAGYGIVTVQYNYDGYPKTSDPGPKHRGTNFFAGAKTASGEVVVDPFIDVSSAAADIDAKAVRYTFSAYLGGFANQADKASAEAQFTYANTVTLRRVTIGPVTAQQRHNLTGLWFRSTTGILPPGTRRIYVYMHAYRSEGATNDGYLDELSFVLHKPKAHK
jgi:hypothetical protein